MKIRTLRYKLCHLGVKTCFRATLARINQKQLASLYETTLQFFIKQIACITPNRRFNYNGTLYLIDTTMVDLCLSVFSRLKFRQSKEATSFLARIALSDYLFEFKNKTDGKTNEINRAKNSDNPMCI